MTNSFTQYVFVVYLTFPSSSQEHEPKHARSYGRFIEIQNNLWGKKLLRIKASIFLEVVLAIETGVLQENIFEAYRGEPSKSITSKGCQVKPGGLEDAVSCPSGGVLGQSPLTKIYFLRPIKSIQIWWFSSSFFSSFLFLSGHWKTSNLQNKHYKLQPRANMKQHYQLSLCFTSSNAKPISCFHMLL